MESVQISDLRCEVQVLQNCMSSFQSYVEAKEYLSDDCFYNERYRDVWKAIDACASKGNELNVVSVFAELSKINPNSKFDTITEINRENLFVTNITTPAIRLKELAIRRKLWLIGNQLVLAGTREDKDLDLVREEALEEVKTLFDMNGMDDLTLVEAFNELLNMIDKNNSGDGAMTGTPTGIRQLDNKGGLQGTDLVVIGGESSQGKTALALKMAYSAIQASNHIAFYSMEMSNTQLSARIVSLGLDMSSSEILYSNSISPIKVNLIQDAMFKVNARYLHLDDRSTSSLDTIMVSIRRMKAKYDIKGAFVDYLQILNVNMKSYNKEQAMAEASRRLKNLAKELDIWIVALSQLKRNEDNPEPNLNRLRDSGQIGEAADVVIFVYRPEVYGKSFPEPFESSDTNGMALIKVDKGRNIGTFKFLMGFNAKRTLFYEVDADKIPEKRNTDDDAPF